MKTTRAAPAPHTNNEPKPTKLRLARLALGWSQERLSRETGIARQNLGGYERTGAFGPGIAARLAKVLGVSADELLADRREAEARYETE